MSTTLDGTIRELLNVPPNVPQWQLKNYLKKIYSIAPKHGISPSIIPDYINFLCRTRLISTSTKVELIEKFLIPNNYLSNDVINSIVTHLGTPTIYTKKPDLIPSKYLQVALCKWLVHVFILLPESQDEDTLSTWLHLWQFDYIQEWITYILLWSTKSPKDIKVWKLKILAKLADNIGYSDSRIRASLILRRYLTILKSSERISNLISHINCDHSSIRALQNLKLNDNFTSTLKKVLVRESPFRFTNKIFEDKLDSLFSQLTDSDMNPLMLKYDYNVPDDKSILSNIETMSQLYKNWDRLDLPNNVDIIISGEKHSLAQLYPLSLANVELINGNKRIQEFWIQMYSYLKINLRRCFQERLMTIQQQTTLFNKIIRCCQTYNRFISNIIKDFLTLDNLLANRELFIIICMKLLPIMSPPQDYTSFRKMVLKILAICYLTKEGNRGKDNWNSTMGSTFGIVCCSFIQMIRNWSVQADSDDDLTKTCIEILNDIRRLLLSNITHSLDNRHLSIPMITLIDTISLFTLKYQFPHVSDKFKSDFLGNVIFKGHVINKLVTLDDPLVLSSCCTYLIRIKDVLKDCPATDPYVKLQNQYIMDLTNYLWRNKISSTKNLFSVPSEYLKSLSENMIGKQRGSSRLKNLYSLSGIAATSNIVFVALRKIEKTQNTERRYLEEINDEGFNNFLSSFGSKENIEKMWLPHVISVQDLKVEIMKELSSIEQYRSIIQFLFTYLKSLSQMSIH